MADKKLRIKGRFVTNEQAIKILGMTQKEVQRLIKEQNNVGHNKRKGKANKRRKLNTEV